MPPCVIKRGIVDWQLRRREVLAGGEMKRIEFCPMYSEGVTKHLSLIDFETHSQ